MNNQNMYTNGLYLNSLEIQQAWDYLIDEYGEHVVSMWEEKRFIDEVGIYWLNQGKEPEQKLELCK